MCEQTLQVVPKRTRPTALRKAEAAVTEARGFADQARGAAEAANRAVAQADARGNQLGERRSSLTVAVEAFADKDQLMTELARIEMVTTTHAAARKHERETRTAAQQSLERVATLDRELEQHWAAHRRQREAFVAPALSPPTSPAIFRHRGVL